MPGDRRVQLRLRRPKAEALKLLAQVIGRAAATRFNKKPAQDDRIIRKEACRETWHCGQPKDR